MEQEKDINEDIKWAQINADVLRSLVSPRKSYWIALAVCVAMMSVAVVAEVYQYNVGMGPANLNNPHMWDLYISTFVFWIGMSHSGTLLSAILHIMHADWRKPIYRFAEAMTAFSLLTAAFFPIIHLGRVWNMYWVLPYYSDRGHWPNFSSPLIWDAFAITTYLCASILFLFIGMIPDLAICRDNARGWRKRLYTILSAGWVGSDKQWRNFRHTYLILACFLIPLAVSVHSIVSTDFAVAIMPGWHVTSFPPYFVAGALYSGCAGIITLFVMLRYFFKFEQYMTIPILEKVAKLTFAIAMVWTYLNLIEFASVWYGHDVYNKEVLIAKATGPYAPVFWTMIICGMVAPFALAVRRFRRHPPTMLVVSLLLNLGMFTERWMIVAPTLSLSHEPHQWDVMWGSIVEWGIVFGSFGWFGFLILVFVKMVPSVSMYEVKEMVFHRRRTVFPWDEGLCTGIQEIDRQHRLIVDVVNELHYAMAQKRGREVLDKTLQAVVTHATAHFKYEETLLREHDYPDLAEQEADHKEMMAKILDFRERVEVGDETVLVELLNFLKTWLTEHIKGKDKQFGKYLAARGVK